MSGIRASINVKGLEEYLENLRKTEANMGAVVSQAIEEGAKIVEADIRAWAEKHKRTGAVLEGVGRSDVQRSGDFYYSQVGIFGEQMDSGRKSFAWHAVFVEYGTPKMKADPGVRPAFQKNKGKIKKIQREILERGGFPNG